MLKISRGYIQKFSRFCQFWGRIEKVRLATLDSSVSVDDLVRVPADANVAVEVKSAPDTGDDEDSGIDLPQQ